MNALLWTCQIPLHGRLVELWLPVERLHTLWAELAPVYDRYGIERALVLSAVLVETAIAPGPDSAIQFFSPRVARRILSTEPVGTVLEADFAARYLRAQLDRFGQRMAKALIAYHTDPDWVSDTGDGLLDDPLCAGFARAVLSTLSMLCETQPWQTWTSALSPPSAVSNTSAPSTSPKGRHRSPRRRRLTPRRQVVNLLVHLHDIDDLGQGGGGPCGDQKSDLREDLLCWKTDLDTLLAQQPVQDQALVNRLGRARQSRAEVAAAFGITRAAVGRRLYRIAARLLRGGFTL